jgi:hypothetical protein
LGDSTRDETEQEGKNRLPNKALLPI